MLGQQHGLEESVDVLRLENRLQQDNLTPRQLQTSVLFPPYQIDPSGFQFHLVILGPMAIVQDQGMHRPLGRVVRCLDFDVAHPLGPLADFGKTHAIAAVGTGTKESVNSAFFAARTSGWQNFRKT